MSTTDMAGNSSSPNTFSDNLLNNIGNITGTKPYVRVGGNSQDLAIYDPNLENATKASFSDSSGIRRFVNVEIGSSFFDSYNTWPNVKFIHGLNMKNSSSGPIGWQSLMDTIPVACQTLQGKLLFWEYGNEPDFYPRPRSAWNDSTYVATWANGTSAIKDLLDQHCPELADEGAFGFVGPSLAEANNLPPQGIFQNGYNKNGSVKVYTLHQ
jgi:hypothetical protein